MWQFTSRRIDYFVDATYVTYYFLYLTRISYLTSSHVAWQQRVKESPYLQINRKHASAPLLYIFKLVVPFLSCGGSYTIPTEISTTQTLVDKTPWEFSENLLFLYVNYHIPYNTQCANILVPPPPPDDQSCTLQYVHHQLHLFWDRSTLMGGGRGAYM